MRKKRKLHLKKESLLLLTATDVRAVLGGDSHDVNTCGCPLQTSCSCQENCSLACTAGGCGETWPC